MVSISYVYNDPVSELDKLPIVQYTILDVA